jgi:hypothetical protein
LTAGFYLDERTATEHFVKYRTVLALLDPNTGAVVGVPVRPTPRWVKPVLITAGVVGALAIMTHGIIPLCFFSHYYCLD